jgi:hypothetical protein
MTTQELIDHAKKMLTKFTNENAKQIYIEACEFFKIYVGVNTSFYKNLEASKGKDGTLANWALYNIMLNDTKSVLSGFISFAENGLYDGISPEKKAKLEVVNDYLNLAQDFLNDKDIHPAAAAVIIGASLEEFLRNWVFSEGLSLGTLNPGIDTYAKELRSKDLIDKQDSKDITSWAGIRNDAAHGVFEKVMDKNKIDLMLQGVNLFLRKYQKK